MGIDSMAPNNGRFLKEDGTAVNIAEKIAVLPDSEYEHLTATIAAGGTISTAVNIAGFKLLAFRILNNWTSANIYYEADTSGAGNNYTPVLADGQEVNEPVAVNDCISVVGNALALAPYDTIKLCSGPSTARVAQAAAVTIEVIVKR